MSELKIPDYLSMSYEVYTEPGPCPVFHNATDVEFIVMLIERIARLETEKQALQQEAARLKECKHTYDVNLRTLENNHRIDMQAESRRLREVVAERDEAIEAADKLAYAIGTVEEIGEHSNCNDPWVQAHIVLLDKLGQLKQCQESAK